MKSLMFVEPGVLRFDEVGAPTILDATDALVRPLAATTCASCAGRCATTAH
jgi:alcohol dehydrogenase